MIGGRKVKQIEAPPFPPRRANDGARGATRSGRRCALAVRYAEILRSAQDDRLGVELIGESERWNLKGGFGGFGGFSVKRNGGRGHHTVGLLRDGG
jgi:hypothetical protein